MSQKCSPNSILNQLQSSEQCELMNAIDQLRSQHLDNDLALPQLIVCGNQSAGKSSVLEAIARVSFPTGESTTTRFASELILRRGPHDNRTAILRPSKEASEREIQHLRQFKPPFERAEDFPTVLEAATRHLSKIQGPAAFSRHCLCIELTGPTQPHLTLIDLPGLISNGDDPTDPGLIEDIVEEYMKQPLSIILAVMSATEDVKNQRAFSKIKECAAQRRTMGILTKPDRAEKNAASEDLTFNLVAQNRTGLGLGWHVLRNRDNASKNANPEARDQQEQMFFSDATSRWSALPAEGRGVGSLRTRLSGVLFDTITTSLPDLKREVNECMKSTKAHLETLGEARPERNEQLLFLDKIISKVRLLTEQSVKAEYGSDVFFDPPSEALREARRLRTTLRGLENSFFQDMHCAQRFHACNESTEDNGMCDVHHTRIKNEDFVLSESTGPGCFTMLAYAKAVQQHITSNSGQILKNLYPPAIIPSIFKIQASGWESCAKDYAESCIAACHSFFSSALGHSTTPYTAGQIMSQVVDRKFEDCRECVSAKITELVFPYRGSQAYTRNPGYGLKTTRNAKRHAGPVSSEFKEPSKVIDRAEALYETCLYTFIDNILSLVVEKCIIEPLRTMLSFNELLPLDDENLAKIAGEPLNDARDRAATKKRLQTLQEVAAVCSKYSNGSLGLSSKTRSTDANVQSQTDPAVVEAERPVTPSRLTRPLSARKRGKLSASQRANPYDLTPPVTPQPGSKSTPPSEPSSPEVSNDADASGEFDWNAEV